MTPTLHERVAERAQAMDIPISAAGVAEIERLLREEAATHEPERTR